MLRRFTLLILRKYRVNAAPLMHTHLAISSLIPIISIFIESTKDLAKIRHSCSLKRRCQVGGCSFMAYICPLHLNLESMPQVLYYSAQLVNALYNSWWSEENLRHLWLSFPFTSFFHFRTRPEFSFGVKSISEMGNSIVQV